MKRGLASGVVLVLIGLIFDAWQPDFLRRLEWKTYDARLTMAKQEPSPDIVVVAIDQQTLDEFGPWPLVRTRYAQMLDRLVAAGAKVIALDIAFPRHEKRALAVARQAREAYEAAVPPSQRNAAYVARLAEIEREADADSALVQAVKRAGNVVLGQFFFSEPRPSAGPPETPPSPYVLDGDSSPMPIIGSAFTSVQSSFAELSEVAGADAGFLNVVVPSEDFITRRSLLALEFQERFYPAFAVQILRRFRDLPAGNMAISFRYSEVRKIRLGGWEIPTDGESGVLINYRSGASSHRTVSAAEVLAGRAAPALFKGKIVLVGSTAMGAGDLHTTPLGLIHGVFIHAHLLDTLLSERRIWRNVWIDWSLIALLGLGMLAILTALPRRWMLVATAGTMAVLGALSWLAMTRGYWVGLVVPAAVILGSFLLAAQRDTSAPKDMPDIESLE